MGKIDVSLLDKIKILAIEGLLSKTAYNHESNLGEAYFYLDDDKKVKMELDHYNVAYKFDRKKQEFYTYKPILEEYAIYEIALELFEDDNLVYKTYYSFLKPEFHGIPEVEKYQFLLSLIEDKKHLNATVKTMEVKFIGEVTTNTIDVIESSFDKLFNEIQFEDSNPKIRTLQ